MNARTPPPITLIELAKGLARDEFVFYYQPKVSLVGGKVNGAEALIRWKKPDGTTIPPGNFIPIAESTGFITEISRAMFPKLVAGCCKNWRTSRSSTPSSEVRTHD